jgi:hypothetical protein
VIMDAATCARWRTREGSLPARIGWLARDRSAACCRRRIQNHRSTFGRGGHSLSDYFCHSENSQGCVTRRSGLEADRKCLRAAQKIGRFLTAIAVGHTNIRSRTCAGHGALQRWTVPTHSATARTTDR